MWARGIELKTPEQIKQMRRAGLVVARALDVVTREVTPGISTAELDAIAAEVIASAGAEPSFLNYGEHNGTGGFPGVVCLSVNEEIVHGIPGSRVIRAGDLVSVDCGAIVNGWHGDAARTVLCPGEADSQVVAERAALSVATRDSMWQGIAAARLGGRVTDIGAAVEDHIDGLRLGYGIVEEYVGHGIGSAMHQNPDVPNYRVRGRGPRITEGMCLCIEPMITIGPPENRTLEDDWTVVTTSGRDAAHWEHAITVTRHGLWVLTAEDGGERMLSELGVPFGPLAD
ncbi:type I methionyl aminopeptidase [Granulicoccus phenolivorans]|uniref:type I methionyl aminopeptidase n=1 Tax=Granulicoccus phenolivorans TaxID=266854 RepID=UPI0009DBC329|nr:type I methionyl aminopeptidase [Granulicoccus phenolivorans]